MSTTANLDIFVKRNKIYSTIVQNVSLLPMSLAALVPLPVLPEAMLALAVVTVAVLSLHAPVAVLLACNTE